jgi:hypothetical protein
LYEFARLSFTGEVVEADQVAPFPLDDDYFSTIIFIIANLEGLIVYDQLHLIFAYRLFSHILQDRT